MRSRSQERAVDNTRCYQCNHLEVTSPPSAATDTTSVAADGEGRGAGAGEGEFYGADAQDAVMQRKQSQVHADVTYLWRCFFFYLDEMNTIGCRITAELLIQLGE